MIATALLESQMSRRDRLWLALKVTALFVVVYFGLNELALSRGIEHSLSFSWEHRIPYIEGFWLPYLSIFVVIYLPGVFLPDRDVLRFARQCTAAILLSGGVFLLWPNVLSFGRSVNPVEVGVFGELVRTLDRPYNTFPSLHVSLATACAAHLTTIASRAALRIWLILTYLSVLFTHQHHVADIGGGLLIAMVVSQEVRTWFFGRAARAAPRPAPSVSPAPSTRQEY